MQARRITENEALRNLAEAQKKLQSEIQVKKDFQDQLEQSLLDRERLGTTPTPASGFQFLQNFIIGTKQRIIRADQAILRANRGVDKAMRMYLHAKKLTRMIENLKDKAFSEFKLQLKKAEQKEQDELTVMRSRLRSDEEGIL
jgi:flagellar export protein FliJ